MWSRGVVVITSASHAEGRRFDPGRDLCFCLWEPSSTVNGFSSLIHNSYSKMRGKPEFPADVQGSGDVLSHLG